MENKICKNCNKKIKKVKKEAEFVYKKYRLCESCFLWEDMLLNTTKE